jgi:Xaa-Pro aminopeptidase
MSVETQTNHRARLEKVREKLAELKLQALIVFSRANIRYLTGFTGSAGVLIVGQGRLGVVDH